MRSLELSRTRTGTESRWWLPGAAGGDGELVFCGDRPSVWKDEKILETRGSDGCTYSRGMCLVPLNCVPEMVKIINVYVMCILPQLEINKFFF